MNDSFSFIFHNILRRKKSLLRDSHTCKLLLLGKRRGKKMRFFVSFIFTNFISSFRIIVLLKKEKKQIGKLLSHW